MRLTRMRLVRSARLPLDVNPWQGTVDQSVPWHRHLPSGQRRDNLLSLQGTVQFQ